MKLLITLLLIAFCFSSIQSRFTASKFLLGGESAAAGAKDAKKDAKGAKDAKADPAAAGASSTGNGALLHEGWLKISSMDLMDFGKYPGVPLDNGENKGIDVEMGAGSFFRSNEKFGSDPEVKGKQLFYFRLSGANLYYTETQTDMRVLGAIAITNVKSVGKSKLGTNCFVCENQEQDKWDICAANKQEKTEWLKAISKALGIPEEEEKPPAPEKEEVLVQQPILMISLPSPYCNEDWNYVSHGEDWNCKCKEGTQQSPVKVPAFGELLNKSAIFTFPSVSVDAVKLVWEDAIVKMVCNSDDCSSFSFGTIIDVDFVEYSAKEVHFHVPSEHQINGKVAPMEIQVVCDPTTEGDFKKKAVISFMVESVPGGSNKFLDKFDYLDLPNVLNWRTKLPTPKDPKAQKISLEDFWRVEEDDTFHGYFSYINYMGSLTNPPCQEETKWFIVEEPLKLGLAAIEMFRDAISVVPTASEGKAALMSNDMPSNAPDGNARSIQELGDRLFYKFDLMLNDCYPKPEKRTAATDGHYERVEKKAITYIYIPNQVPTGLPNALVVTKEEATGKDRRR